MFLLKKWWGFFKLGSRRSGAFSTTRVYISQEIGGFYFSSTDKNSKRPYVVLAAALIF